MINDYTNYVSGNDFLNSNADIKTAENNFDYNSFYRAYVIDNNDPEKLGRVKIMIPTLHSANGFYPWAYPACFTGLGFQTGQFLLPPKGAVVFVTFEYSDEHRPIYFGGIPSRYAAGKTQSYGSRINDGAEIAIDGDDLPEEYTGTQQIIYKAPNGDIIYIDSDDDYGGIYLRSYQGMEFSISEELDTDENGVVTRNGYIEMKYNDKNYFKIKKDSFEWYSKGEPVDIGGGGGSGDGTARTIIWD